MKSAGALRNGAMMLAAGAALIAVIALASPAEGGNGITALKKQVTKLKKKVTRLGKRPAPIRMDFRASETDNVDRTVLVFQGLTMKAICFNDSGRARLKYKLSSTQPGLYSDVISYSENSGSVSQSARDDFPLGAGLTDIGGAGSLTPGFLTHGQVIGEFRSATYVIGLSFHVVADDIDGTCALYGTAVVAG